MAHRFLLLLFILLSGFRMLPQDFSGLRFGSDHTLEVVTWNLENFPKKGNTTLNLVSQIIQAMDVDVIAFQEIEDSAAFRQMIHDLGGYGCYFKTGYFAGLAYAYKTESLTINQFYQIYTSSAYWKPFPRAPMIMDFDFGGSNFMVINNHFKCCGDGFLDLSNPDDEETRRYRATNLLKDHIDNFLYNRNIIIAGDLNDEITDPWAHNVFRDIIDDVYNYRFADEDIANGPSAGWSYPSWPSHLDHLIVTNELFGPLANDSSEVKTLKPDHFLSGGWWEYNKNISDHRPVGIRLKISPGLGLSQTASHALATVAPNPFNHGTHIQFGPFAGEAGLTIYAPTGQRVFSAIADPGQTRFYWDAHGLPPGIYMLQITTAGLVTARVKLALFR